MTGANGKEFGRRVAFLRKKLGYSQSEFASRIDRSEAWLSQVERGVRAIDRMSVLQRLADGLGVPITVLSPDQPVVAAAAAGTAPTPAGALALAVASNYALRALLTDPDVLAAEDLEASATQAWEYTHEARYAQLSDLLLDLIPDVEMADRHAPEGDRPRVRGAKVRTYLAAAGALTKLGESGAAWVAVERAMATAESLGDPLLVAEGAFRLAIAFQASGRFDLAARVASSAAGALMSLVEPENATPAAVAVFGALHLQLAVAAARTNEADLAYAYLGTAERAAERIGDGRNDYNTEFGPTNVVLHEVAIAVELGDAGRALRAAERANAAGLSPERRGRLLIDVARAQGQMRRPDAIISALTEGWAISPEQYASHPRVRELVADLLRTDHRNRPDVKALAERIIHLNP
ncbi:MAG: helix-turn-helix transcriptional regulator [Pseudonocardiales bacterium]|nr:helix-turn-helix transcriptional regulator [Pseudonocardiales bacterium]